MPIERAAADPVVIDAPTDATLETEVTGPVDLVKTGGATLTIATATSHTGSTTIAAGTLRMGVADALAGSSAIFLNNGATFDLAGYDQTIKSLDSYNFTTGQLDAGTLALGGATLVNLTAAQNNWVGSITGTGAFEKRGTATMNWLWGTNTFSGTLAITAGTLATGSAGVLSANAVVSIGTNGTLFLDGHSQTVGGLAGAGAVSLGAATLTTDQSADTIFSGVLSGVGGLTKSGAGKLTLTGANTYTGATTVSGGTLALGVANALSADTALTIDDGATVTTGARAQTVGSLAGAGTLDFGPGKFTAGGDDRSTTFSGAIVGLDGGQLVKTGSGTLTLTGTNSYSVTTVNAGTVVFASEGAFTPTALVNVASGASVDFGDSARIIYQLNSQGTVSFGSGGLTLGISGGSGTIAGTLTGTGGITKTGAGQYVLSGTASYAGPTTIEGGSLVFASREALYGGDTAKWTADNLTVNAGTTALFRLGTGANDFSGADAAVVAAISSATGGFRPGSYVGFDTSNASSTLTIADDLAFGTGVGLAKSGAATLELTGTNTLTGELRVSSGTLRLDSGTTVNTTGVINVAGGAKLETNGASLTVSEVKGAGTVDVSGSNLTLNVNGTAYLDNTSITGSGTVTMAGTGTLLSMPVDWGGGPQTFTGGLIITSGTVQVMAYSVYDMPDNLGAPGAPVTLAGGRLELDGQMSRPLILANGGGTLAKMAGSFMAEEFYGDITGDAASTLTIDAYSTWLGFGLGGNNTYAGPTFIQSGKLTLLSSTALPIGNRVTLATGAVLDLSGYTATLGALSGPGGVWLGYNSVLTMANTDDQTIDATLNGYGRLVKTGAGTLTYAGTNDYTGGTTVNEGRLVLASAGALASGTAMTVAAGAAVDFGSYARTVSALNSAGSVAFAGDLTLGANNAGGTIAGTFDGSGALTKTGSGAYTISADATLTGGLSVLGGSLTLGSGTTLTTGTALNVASSATLATNGATLTVGGATGGGTIDLGGNKLTFAIDSDQSLGVTLTGTGGFTKSGAGTLTVAGANTYTGTTTLAAGTLRLGSSSALGGTAKLALAAGTTLDLQGHDLATSSLSGAGAIDLGAGRLTSDVESMHWQIFDGTITGSGGLTKTGFGALSLYGAQTYTGTTVISAGSLEIGGAGFASSAVVDEGNFSVSHNGTLTLAADISGGGQVAFGGTGTTTLTGTNTFAGGLMIDQHTVRLGSAQALPTGVQMEIHGTLDLNNHAQTLGAFEGQGEIKLGTARLTAAVEGASADFSGVISGTGGVTKTGAETLLLSGVNTYTGTTLVNAGKLVVDGSIAGSAVTVNAGGTLGGSGEVGALTIASGGTLAPGNSPGTLIAGDTTFAGGGRFEFQLESVTGGAGGAHGWDLLSISGQLALGATAGNKFTVFLQSLDANGTPGLVADFDPRHSYSFVFATTTTGIVDFDPAKFAIDLGDFANASPGTWSVALLGNSLALDYTYSAGSPIPEPATTAALAAAAVLAAALLRRRRASAGR